VQLQVAGGMRYEWSPSTGLNNSNIANPIANPSQTTTYSVKVYNQYNCSKDISLTLLVYPTITTDFEVLLGDNCNRFPLVSLRNLSNPSKNVSYSWDFGNGQGSNLENPVPFRYAQAGNYLIRLLVGNEGCKIEKTYNLLYNENSDSEFWKRISVSPTQKLCSGDSTQLYSTGGTSYSWSPNIALTNPTIANPKAFPKTTTLYTVRIANNLGCYRDTSILVVVAPKVQIDFGIDLQASCDQEYPLVKLTPDFQNGEIYRWDFGNDSIYVGKLPPIFRYNKAGTYIIKVKGSNQLCEKEFSKTIKIEKNIVDFAKKILILPQKPTICVGESVQLQVTQVTGIAKYLWTPATGLSNPNIWNPIAKPSITTRYNVRITNESGCYVDSSVLIVVAAEVKADFELKVSSECGKNGAVTFVNKSTGTGEYKWTLSNGVEIREQNPKEYGFEKSGEYEIILEVFNGICRKTKSQKIRVESIIPPNVITPNGDGKNDKFMLDVLQEGWKLEIYDRYGSLKFKTDNYKNEWGGETENQTYYYLLTSPDGKTCKGWIQVFKGQ
jgi:gliding motility-associated-like protein